MFVTMKWENVKIIGVRVDESLARLFVLLLPFMTTLGALSVYTKLSKKTTIEVY